MEYSLINVNFSFDLLERLSGWTPEQLEELEGDLDYFLDQEVVAEFKGEAEDVRGIAFYAMSDDYLVTAYDLDDNECSFTVDNDRLELVAIRAIEQIRRYTP